MKFPSQIAAILVVAVLGTAGLGAVTLAVAGQDHGGWSGKHHGGKSMCHRGDHGKGGKGGGMDHWRGRHGRAGMQPEPLPCGGKTGARAAEGNR